MQPLPAATLNPLAPTTHPSFLQQPHTMPHQQPHAAHTTAQQQQQAHTSKGQGEQNIMLLINAADELRRSEDTGKEAGSREPSTAATPGPAGESAR